MLATISLGILTAIVWIVLAAVAYLFHEILDASDNNFALTIIFAAIVAILFLFVIQITYNIWNDPDIHIFQHHFAPT